MNYIPKRPRGLPGRTVAVETHCGRLYVTVTCDPVSGEPREVFCRFGKAGGCGSAVMDGMTRMISLGLACGVDAEEIIKGLAGIGCHLGPRTCLNAVAEAIGEALPERDNLVEQRVLFGGGRQ